MKLQRILIIPCMCFLMLTMGCARKYVLSEEQKKLLVSQEFSNYWFQGKAELTSYDLKQARYGEVHNGHAVLIFVTEDFSFNKFVKLDRPRESPDDALKVMKLNFTKKFNTGVYPYSIMQSIFTPLNEEAFPYSLKISTSSQEWCGHTYSNMNLGWDGYTYSGASYFESEVSTKVKLDRAMTEDELWTQIRLDPGKLPVGDIRLIPSAVFARLRHSELKVESAKAELEETKDEDSNATYKYSVQYADLPRSLTIVFEKEFPFKILAWEEKQVSGFGPSAKELVTSGVLKKQIMLDYWDKHSVADSVYRSQLGLP